MLKSPASSAESFEAEVTAVLSRVRSSLAQIISLVPQQITTAADLERELGVRKTLAWQVFRTAQASDPLAQGPQLPGKRAMERFFEAAAKAGVSRQPLNDARKAVEE